MHAYIHTNMYTDIIMTHSHVATHANILRNLALHALIFNMTIILKLATVQWVIFESLNFEKTSAGRGFETIF